MNLFNKNNDTQVATQTPPRRTLVPRYTVREGADAFTLTATVPGVDRSALEIQAEGEHLTVFARRTWTPRRTRPRSTAKSPTPITGSCLSSIIASTATRSAPS